MILTGKKILEERQKKMGAVDNTPIMRVFTLLYENTQE